MGGADKVLVLNVYFEHHPRDYNRALEYYRKSEEIRIRALGEDHPLLASTRNNLGMSLEALGRYQEAIETCE